MKLLLTNVIVLFIEYLSNFFMFHVYYFFPTARNNFIKNIKF
jgi:hypothetical protein